MKDTIITDLNEKLYRIEIKLNVKIEEDSSKIKIIGDDYCLTVFKKKNGYNSFLKQGKTPDKCDSIINVLIKDYRLEEQQKIDEKKNVYKFKF